MKKNSKLLILAAFLSLALSGCGGSTGNRNSSSSQGSASSHQSSEGISAESSSQGGISSHSSESGGSVCDECNWRKLLPARLDESK